MKNRDRYADSKSPLVLTQDEKSLLLGIVGHELRGTVHELGSAFSLLQKRIETIPQESVSLFNRIDESLKKISNVTKYFSYFLDDEPRTFVDIVDLNSTLEEVLKEVTSRKESPNLSITMPALPRLKGCAARFRFIFREIILSAIDGVSNGDIRVMIDSGPRQDDADDLLEITFQHTGRKITERETETLFIPRFEDKEARIGLALSRKMILLFGGKLTASPLRDGGISFRMALPKTMIAGT